MTDFNKYNPYPYLATIRGPRCRHAAEFRKAFALINEKSWSWWTMRLWPSARATDWEGKERWVPGDPPPTWRGWIVIEQDPALYCWKKPPQSYKTSDAGIVSCARCVGRRAHTLTWPADAYYQFQLPQGLLWAWSRDGVTALIAFLESAERDPSAHGDHCFFLRHIPKAFLGAKDRK